MGEKKLKEKKKLKDLHARIIAYLSIAVSLGTLLVSFFSYRFSISKHQESQKDILNIEFRGYLDEKKILIDKLGPNTNRPGEIVSWVHYKVFVSNIGERDLSIVDHFVYWVMNDEGKEYPISFNEYDIFDSDFNKLEFPIQLAVGEAKELIVNLSIHNLVADDKSFKERFEVGEKYSFDELSSFLSKLRERNPFNGDSLRKVYMMKDGTLPPYLRRFRVGFRTSKGDQYDTIIYPYFFMPSY